MDTVLSEFSGRSSKVLESICEIRQGLSVCVGVEVFISYLNGYCLEE